MRTRSVLLLEAAIAFAGWILLGWWLWPRLVILRELTQAAGFASIETETLVRVGLVMAAQVTLLAVGLQRLFRYWR